MLVLLYVAFYSPTSRLLAKKDKFFLTWQSLRSNMSAWLYVGFYNLTLKLPEKESTTLRHIAENKV